MGGSKSKESPPPETAAEISSDPVADRMRVLQSTQNRHLSARSASAHTVSVTRPKLQLPPVSCNLIHQRLDENHDSIQLATPLPKKTESTSLTSSVTGTTTSSRAATNNISPSSSTPLQKTDTTCEAKTDTTTSSSEAKTNTTTSSRVATNNISPSSSTPLQKTDTTCEAKTDTTTSSSEANTNTTTSSRAATNNIWSSSSTPLQKTCTTCEAKTNTTTSSRVAANHISPSGSASSKKSVSLSPGVFSAKDITREKPNCLAVPVYIDSPASASISFADVPGSISQKGKLSLNQERCAQCTLSTTIDGQRQAYETSVPTAASPTYQQDPLHVTSITADGTALCNRLHGGARPKVFGKVTSQSSTAIKGKTSGNNRMINDLKQFVDLSGSQAAKPKQLEGECKTQESLPALRGILKSPSHRFRHVLDISKNEIVTPVLSKHRPKQVDAHNVISRRFVSRRSLDDYENRTYQQCAEKTQQEGQKEMFKEKKEITIVPDISLPGQVTVHEVQSVGECKTQESPPALRGILKSSSHGSRHATDISKNEILSPVLSKHRSEVNTRPFLRRHSLDDNEKLTYQKFAKKTQQEGQKEMFKEKKEITIVPDISLTGQVHEVKMRPSTQLNQNCGTSEQTEETSMDVLRCSSPDSSIKNAADKSDSLMVDLACPLPFCFCPVSKGPIDLNLDDHDKPIRKTFAKKTQQPGKTDILKAKKKTNKVELDIYGFIKSDILQSYIEYMQQKPIPFDLLKVIHTKDEDNKPVSTWSLLQFTSTKQASLFVKDINHTVHNPQVKTSFHIEDCLSTTELHALEQKTWREIADKIQAPLSEHSRKIADLKEQLAAKVNETHKTMHIALQSHALDERDALMSKIEEAELAQSVFCAYLDGTKAELETIEQQEDKTKFIKQINHDFAIELHRFSSCLPMYGRKTDIVDTVRDNQVCVVLGETGSGKSTQMVQYLYQAGFAKTGQIVCTQPRKIAAVSLAQHVSQEMNSAVGQVVGYEVGMQKRKSNATSILYVTDHLLLRGTLDDPLFGEYSCIVIDEAHERSLHTDLLLGMIKKCLPSRPDLRVVITSATIVPDAFVKYFGDCPVLKVSGRTFPVDVSYLNDNPSEDYVSEAVNKAIDIHLTESPGDILVFLTSGQETERAEKIMKIKMTNANSIEVLQLHGKLQGADQRKVFEKTLKGKRKVVFATNCAETSLTIVGIKYVVDSGMVKAMSYDHSRNMNVLKEQLITQSSAEQRKGRAGRTQSGKCFRLFTSEQFDSMQKETAPEIMRIHLGMGLLQLLLLGVCDYNDFNFVQSPPKQALDNAMSELEELGACQSGKITGLGMKMAKLSVEPRLAKMLLLGIKLDVGYECLVMAAFGTIPGSVFYRAGDQKAKDLADRKKLRFCEDQGDLITLLTVFKEWFAVNDKKKNDWCFKNSINGKAMKMARDAMNELSDKLKRELNILVNVKFSSNEANLVKIICVVLHCYARNLCYFSGHSKIGYYVARTLDTNLHLHPSSALQCCEEMPKWVVYTSVLSTSRSFMLNVTAIEDSWVIHMVTNKLLCIDLEGLDDLSLERLHFPQIGPMTLRKLVGPRFTKLKEMEEELCSDKKVIVDASFATCSLDVFSHWSMSEYAEDYMELKVDDVKQLLKAETLEVSLSGGSPIRAVVSSGMQISGILYPGEYRCVVIRDVPKGYDTSDVEVELSEFGPLDNIDKFNPKVPNPRVPWGKAMYRSHVHAKNAVSSEDLPFQVQADSNGYQSQCESEYSLKLQWIRRPLKGFAFVGVQNVDAHVVATSVKRVYFPTAINPAIVQVNRKSPCELHIRNIDRSLLENEVREAIEQSLTRDHPELHISKLVLPKENATPTSKRDIAMFKRRIETLLQNDGIDKNGVTINILKSSPQAANHIAYLYFMDAEIGGKAERAFVDATIDGKQVHVSGQLQLSVRFPNDVFRQVERLVSLLIDDFIDRFESQIKITRKELKNGSVSFTISSGSTDIASLVQNKLSQIRNGTCIEADPDSIRHLGNEKHFLSKIQRQRRVLAKLDHRLSQVVLYGEDKGVAGAREDISSFIKDRKRCITLHIPLKGDGIPKGLMKKLIRHYGFHFTDLRLESGVKSLDLLIRQHVMVGVGSIETLGILKTLIKNLYPSKDDALIAETNITDCPVCTCPVEGQPVLVEICGHEYCRECITSLINNAIQSKEFPIKCASDGCGEPLAISDIRNIMGNVETDLRSLMLSSLDAYISSNKKSVKPCKTPDCPGVYRVTKTVNKFKCPECNNASICTRCHQDYHLDVTCAQKESMANDPDYMLKKWMSENSENRASCPKCSTPIEKNGGCHKVHCRGCKVHICWVCKKTFTDGGSCYAHINNNHGGHG